MAVPSSSRPSGCLRAPLRGVLLWAALWPRDAAPSSHRDSPLLVEDPAVDATDLYVFRSPQTDTCASSESLNILVNYGPMQDPGGGPLWSRLSDQALYEIHIDQDGDAVADITYQFRFRTEYRSPSGVLLSSAPLGGTSLLDPALRVVQRYTVTRIDKGQGQKVLLRDMPVPPPNLGAFSAPGYTALADAGVYPLDGDRVQNGLVFVGPRDDPYFADQGALFDLLRFRCAATPNDAAGCGVGATARKGVDFFAGYAVNTIALQLPISRLLKGNAQPGGKDQILGIYATASRPRLRMLRTPSTAATQSGVPPQDHAGPFVQVSRIGLPLMSTLLIPIALRDAYGTSRPAGDRAFFASDLGRPLLADPELAQVLRRLYAVDVPAAGRTDLSDLLQFQISIAGTVRPPFRGTEYGLTPADILRIDVAQPPPADLSTNRMGAIGRLVNGVADPSTGFPNGRRPQDDVVDILLSTAAGVLRGKGAQLGDGVDGNDRTLTACFPYLPPPAAGSAVNPKGATTAPLLHTVY
jgi:hypothetical protein